MIYSNACSYAIQAMTRIALMRPDGYVLLDELCDGTDLPREFVAKIFQDLVRRGVLHSAKGRFALSPTDTTANKPALAPMPVIPAVPVPDKINNSIQEQPLPHPPPSETSEASPAYRKAEINPPGDALAKPQQPTMSRDMLRFLADVAAKPLSTTVSRYQRLHLSRRRGNAIRQQLAAAGVIEAATIATRSGQVVLYELTDPGRQLCIAANIDPGFRGRASLEHRYWVFRAAEHFAKQGYAITHEHVIAGNGAVDVVAERPGQRIAVEVETGKSDIPANLSKVAGAGFDRVVLIATSPEAVGQCQKAMAESGLQVAELLTWLDVS